MSQPKCEVPITLGKYNLSWMRSQAAYGLIQCVCGNSDFYGAGHGPWRRNTLHLTKSLASAISVFDHCIGSRTGVIVDSQVLQVGSNGKSGKFPQFQRFAGGFLACFRSSNPPGSTFGIVTTLLDNNKWVNCPSEHGSRCLGF